MHLLCQIHGRQVVVSLKKLLNGISHQLGLLLKTADFLGENQENPQLVAVNIILELAQNADHWSLHRLELGF